MHGIGGNTVAQAKETLTVTEVRRWAAYVGRYGSLNVAKRVAESSGVVAFVVAKSMADPKRAGSIKLEHFIPHYSEGRIHDINEAMTIISKGAGHGKKPRNTNG